jgi:amidase
LDRRDFLRAAVSTGALAAAQAVSTTGTAYAVGTGGEAGAQDAKSPGFDLEEKTIQELRQGIDSGRWTARAITAAYLTRIEQLDRQGPELRAILETNPDALARAEALDQDRKSGTRGALAGVPILLKDNIATADRMTTTAGSLALAGSIAATDATVAKKLRDAGAVLLAKTNMSEWANFRSEMSSSGWSARGGQCRNPYVLDRNPCGSSSGSGTAVSANLGAAAIGTETDGSIVCPSSSCGLVGLKPTVGLVSRAGIIPISHTQDTAGPMTRTVADAALLLGALAGPDPRDAATEASSGHLHADYTQFLDAKGLSGARIGVARQYFGFHRDVDQAMKEVLTALASLGAVLIDPVEMIPDADINDAELIVLLYEFKGDLNAYLAGLGGKAPVKSLAEAIAFNEQHAAEEMPYFGQELFRKAEAKGPLTDQEYVDALAKCGELAREKGIDAVMDKHRLDAVLAPTGGPAWVTDCVNGDHFGGGCSTLPAVAGYPHITVPAGLIRGLPVGVSFFGRAWSEPVLIRIAFAYEQATRHRRPPRFLPTAQL